MILEVFDCFSVLNQNILEFFPSFLSFQCGHFVELVFLPFEEWKAKKKKKLNFKIKKKKRKTKNWQNRSEKSKFGSIKLPASTCKNRLNTFIVLSMQIESINHFYCFIFISLLSHFISFGLMERETVTVIHQSFDGISNKYLRLWTFTT